MTVVPTPVKCCHVSAKGGMLVEGQEFQCFHRTTVFLHLLLSSSSPFGNEGQQFHCNIKLIKSRKFSLWYVMVYLTNVLLYKTKIKKSHMKGKVTECKAATLEPLYIQHCLFQ